MMPLWFSWIHEEDDDGEPIYREEGQSQQAGEWAGYNVVRGRLIHHLRRAGIVVLDGGPPVRGCVQIAHTPLFNQRSEKSVWKRNKEAALHIAYTTFESEIFPKRWVDDVNEFDAAFTTSHWSRRCMIASGIEIPIFVVQHGVEPGRYPPMYRPTRDTFTFLWQGTIAGDLRWLEYGEPDLPPGITGDNPFGDPGEVDDKGAPLPAEQSEWYLRIGEDVNSPAALAARQARMAVSDRKQSVLVREALMRLQKRGDIGRDVRLVLKWSTLHSAPYVFPQHAIDNLTNEQASCYGSSMDINDLRSLIYNADCSVMPSRCEGFGMIPLEHMASGLPCIYTAYSGHEDFLRREDGPGFLGYPLKFEMGKSWRTQVAEIGPDPRMGPGRYVDGELAIDMQATGGHFGQDAWPDVNHLMEMMVMCYENRKKVRDRALDDALYIHRHWHWDRAVQQVLEAFEVLGVGDEILWSNRNQERLRTSITARNLHALAT